jgi:RNA polymerase sigma-70 factor (ECF subfamily)
MGDSADEGRSTGQKTRDGKWCECPSRSRIPILPIEGNLPGKGLDRMASHESMADEALVEGIRAGDEEAFRVLADRYSRKLHAHVQRRLLPGMRRRLAASDILQEANLVVLERCSDFENRGDGSFRRWYSRIVDLKVKEAVERHVQTGKRGVGEEVSRSGRGSTAGFPARGPSPSQVAAGRELREAVRSAMKDLPEIYREVLVLVQERQLGMKEASKHLGRSPDAVRKLYGRALARMEELLGLEGEVRHGRRKPTR